MKTKFLAGSGIILIASVLLFSCKKNVSNEVDGGTVEPSIIRDSSEIPFPQSVAPGCNTAPDYGDTLVCAQPLNGQDYIVSPVNNSVSGKYMSWPLGMKLDSVTGAINVTQSETGLKYVIGFVKNGTTDTCLSELIISGASYMDSIHVLSEGEKKSSPYYNADPNLRSKCATGNCEFDITNEANNKKIAVNKQTGEIDLEKSLNQGAFGLLPLNGDMTEATIYYKINDGCNTSVQHITVQLMYFNKKSQIGSGLLGNILSKITNLLNGNIISSTANPRPPLIIITRTN